VSADDADNRTIREQIVEAVLGTHFDQVPIIVASRVPDGWPSSLVPPPPASTLGGMIAGTVRTVLTAVFRYPPSVEQPLSEYRAVLERDGWSRPRGVMSEGFESSSVAMYLRDSMMLHVHRPPTDAGDGLIVVSVAPGPGELRPSRFPHNDTLEVPRLMPPPRVRRDNGGGSHSGGSSGPSLGGSGSGGGGGSRYTTRHISVTTDLTPQALLSSYASQLASAGWITGVVHTTTDNATQWLEATDTNGRTWRGVLVVYVNGPARDVFIYMATHLQ
jgi:hypothetical protein